MSTRFIARPTRWLAAPESDPRLFAQRGFVVEIDDEGAGEFVVVRSNQPCGDSQIKLDPSDWRAIQDAVDLALLNIREHDDKSDD